MARYLEVAHLLLDVSAMASGTQDPGWASDRSCRFPQELGGSDRVMVGDDDHTIHPIRPEHGAGVGGL
jgi:hypothetical protein